MTLIRTTRKKMKEELLRDNYGDNVAGWCCNCKEPILKGDDVATKSNKTYCLFCFKQIDTFIDDESSYE